MDDESEGSVDLLDIAIPLLESWKLWILGSLAAGLIAFGITYLIAPVFTARTTLLPPQQQQGGAASALAALGGLASLTGAAGFKGPSDQYVALMQSVTAEDRLIERFKLIQVYGVRYRFEARRELEKNTRIAIGKKDGLISVEVDDESPQRAAEIANGYVEELRRLTALLAVSEAQQRRLFFENGLKEARDQLAKAQQDLQSSGFNVGALRAEPKAAADSYARLKAEIASAEVRLQVLRGSLTDSSTPVQQQLAQLSALRAQLSRLEQTTQTDAGPDYVSKYREFKYRETLFDLFARQYEAARIDESREGSLIQVVDVALTPEYKSKPKRSFYIAVATLAALFILGMVILVRHFWRVSASRTDGQGAVAQLRAAFRRS